MRTIPKVFVRPFKTDDRAFFPDWKCFCCRDKGYLLERDIKQFIDPDYSEQFCGTAQCAYCQAEKPAFAHNLLSFSECEEIHLFNLNDWKNTAKNWESLKAERKEVMDKMAKFLGGLDINPPGRDKAIAAFTGGHYDDHQSERLENIEKAKQEFDF